MAVKKIVDMLVGLLSGALDIEKFDQELSDALFELRQKPKLTDEKRMLSKIQLYLHEFKEDNRDILEVYIAAQSALDLLKFPESPVTIKTDFHVPSHQSGEVVPTSSESLYTYEKLEPLPV